MSEVRECPFDALLTRRLPHIFREIFLALEPDDLFCCRRVCKRWRQAIDEHVLGDEKTWKVLQVSTFTE